MIGIVESMDFRYLAKPAGLPVFPPHAGEGDSLLSRFLDEQPAAELPEDGGQWPEGFAGGILHRLDGWTSGLLIAARSLAALELGRQRFTSGELHKHYSFRSARDVPWDEHRIDFPLAHDRRDRRKMIWQRGKNTPHRGKWYPAMTSFLRLDAGLWEAVIRSGVTHQVRVHAAAVGLPILGDRLYGGAKDPCDQGRFYLHHLRVEGWPDPAIPELPSPSWPT